MLNPEIIANIYFYKTEDGGRKAATTANQFSCIFSVITDNEKHDCRLFLNEVGSIAPGEHKNAVPIKFLCPELVLPKLKIGTKFYLWDMRNIAEGEVVVINA